MIERPRVVFNDSEDMGFALTCLVFSAISFDEFKEWLYHLIELHDDMPTYFYDLIDLDYQGRSQLHHHEIYGGWLPSWDSSLDKQDAVLGIAIIRHPETASGAYRDGLLGMLEQNPDVLEQFKKTFPFISLSKR